MTATTTPPGPAVDRRRPGRRAKLWLPPRGVTGTQIRALAKLSPGRRAVGLALAAVTGVCAAALGDFSGVAWLSPVALVLGIFLVVQLHKTWLRRIRLRHGFVRVTEVQFDLACALGELPAARIDEGRHLYDALVRHLQQQPADASAIDEVERRMQHLLASAWQQGAGPARA